MVEKTIKKRCVIIAAAPFNENELDFIKKEIHEDDFIICADGGFEKASKVNITPNLLIGDLDSNKVKVPDCIKIIRLPVRKDDTDTMMCIKKAIELKFNEVIILGAIKGRIDHALANISVLLYAEKHGLKACLKDDETEIYVVVAKNKNKSELEINNQKGCTVSIFPFGVSFIKLSLKGFEYPLDNKVIYIDNPIGISNVIIDDTANITLTDGVAAILLIKNE